jgi:hypothetical protein
METAYRFCDSRLSPARTGLVGVQNPCPKSTSHNQPCHRVLRRSRAWDTCSAMPASPPPTSNPSSRLTPSRRLAATGCSPRPPAAPAPTAPPSSRSWTSCAPATSWPSGSSIGWVGHCGIWSTPSLAWRSAGSGSAASRRRSTPPPRQARVPCVCRLGRVRTRPHPGADHCRAGCCSGPRPPRRPTIGAHRAQAPGGPGDVQLWAVHRGGDRQDLGGQPRLDLPAPHSRRRQPNLTVRPKPWTLPCECALKEVRSPSESVGKGR